MCSDVDDICKFQLVDRCSFIVSGLKILKVKGSQTSLLQLSICSHAICEEAA